MEIYPKDGTTSFPVACKVGRLRFGNCATIEWTNSGPLFCKRNSQFGYHFACSSHGTSSCLQFCKPPLQ